VRTTPLLATQAGDTLLIVASRAGDDRHPAWFHNLRTNPDVEITVRGRRHPMRARIADGEERASLWATVCDNYSGYAAYQRRALGRAIPVIALTPRD
jgi:deazaflavin-dependent oxidoreductase (nitroreductase family)